MKNPSLATNGIVARDLIRLLLLGILIALVVTSTAFSQEVKIPRLLKRVTDFTNTLSATELASLEQDLARFEDSTSNQLVVVVIPTVGNEAIEEFALRTAEANGIGQKGKDNGILLLIAKNDRAIRIQVGYGLEGVLPDGLAGTIIRREITPAFRENNFYGGIKAGVEAIMLATRNEYKAEKVKKRDLSPFLVAMFFFFIFFVIMRNARRRTGVMGSALPLLFGSSLGNRSRGGWGGGGGGSSGGFGGFSGGGGSFGGGGASGGW